MAYFSNIPNFDYISRVAGAKNINDYITVKNLFKRVKLRDDVFNEMTNFTDYNIFANEKPSDVAYKFYDSENLDWLILMSNNIVNVYEEWPLDQRSFDAYLLDKYGSYEGINATHHYETEELRDQRGSIIVPEGMRVQADFSITFRDGTQDRTATNFTYEVTNLDYETKIQEERRRIRYLRPELLNLVFDDMRRLLRYKEGSTQYVSGTLKKGDNLRIFSF